MIPCCCICGKSPKTWDAEWNGLQDFCEEHKLLIETKYSKLEQYIVPHMKERELEKNI